MCGCLSLSAGPNEEYEWLTYSVVLERAQHIGSGMILNGIKPKEFVGLFAANCIEWVLCEQACTSFSMVTVPLYDTLGPSAIEHILNQAELKMVVCDAKSLPKLLEHKKNTPDLKLIVKTTAIEEEEKKQAAEMGVELMCLSDLEQQGAADVQVEVPPKPDDMALVCYTSGTTGAPKGAMISHRNLIADTSALITCTKGLISWDPSVTHLSYLPLAHIFERGVQALVFSCGGRIGFFRGDVKLLLDDLAVLKPTMFPSVPRLLNRVYDKVMDSVAQGGAIKRALFNMAMAKKRQEVQRGIIRNDSIWDKLVFKKVQARLGGNVRVLVTGAAPISDPVLDFLRCSLGCIVMQGYGQTECAAGATITSAGDPALGSVGAPLPCNEVKLIGVPELGYHEDDNCGEICFRGHNVFLGYLKDDAKTKETIDEDGWLHSGDIGRWNPNGTLSIIDRKKQIFKLSQGEYVAPEKVEMVYQCCPFVGQVFLHGDSLQSACVAVVVVDEATVPRWAEQKHIAGSLEELCANEAVRKAVLTQITEAGRAAHLKSFEQAKAIHLHPVQFSVDEDLMTPTFKLKRPQLKRYFDDQITAMYESLPK